MNELLTLAFALVAGLLLGTVFFGSLWWTVRKGIASKHAELWFIAGPLLRMSFALAGFYFVSGRHWERLLFCLLGFIIARRVVIQLTRPPGENQIRPAQEASHAP